MEDSNKTVIVAMSGGVDSSVAALLLKEKGYNVIGLFMKNWEELDADGVCKSQQDLDDVARVCEQIDIPYYTVNFVEEYRQNVFLEFLAEFQKGYTPNPDILCNREIKFKVLFEKALQMGADFLATGHYCQTYDGNLLKGEDLSKDQSYFLYTLNSNTLKRVLFPVGNMKKKELRRLAAKHNLVTSAKKDSTGICFIGKRNFKDFLNRYIQYQKGDFETLDGRKVGTHDGVAFYTLGQRKGLGIGGAGDAWFVVGKDVSRNIVFVEQGERHPALYCDELIASNLSWVVEQPSLPFKCTSKVRYRQEDQPCTIQKIENGKAWVVFDLPQRAVTPRQSVVFYDGNICFGGGIIEQGGKTYHELKKQLPKEVL